jgi:hypothetical protein
MMARFKESQSSKDWLSCVPARGGDSTPVVVL